MDQFFETFFSWQHLKDSFASVLKGFTTNLSLMFVAEGFVLVWGLVLALLRRGRGPLGAPPALAVDRLHRPVPGHSWAGADLHDRLRHSDLGGALLQRLVAVFAGRARPDQLVRGLCGRGLPGRDREHLLEPDRGRPLPGAVPGQDDALRGPVPGRPAGRPAAAQRLHRPAEGHCLHRYHRGPGRVPAAQIYAGTEFNLTSFTGLALCFVVITFPMTRLADRLLKRDAARLRAGGR